MDEWFLLVTDGRIISYMCIPKYNLGMRIVNGGIKIILKPYTIV